MNASVTPPRPIASDAGSRLRNSALTCVPDEMDSPQSPVRKPVIHRRY